LTDKAQNNQQAVTQNFERLRGYRMAGAFSPHFAPRSRPDHDFWLQPERWVKKPAGLGVAGLLQRLTGSFQPRLTAG